MSFSAISAAIPKATPTRAITTAILVKPDYRPPMSDAPKQLHWTNAQYALLERRFVVRGWATQWLRRIYECLNASPLDARNDAKEAGIMRSQESLCQAIGCSPVTLWTYIRRLETLGVLEIENCYGRGENGRPHRRPNCMMPRRIISDAPRPVTDQPRLVKVRAKRWLRPQYYDFSVPSNKRAVEDRTLSLPLFFNVSEEPRAQKRGLDGFRERQEERRRSLKPSYRLP